MRNPLIFLLALLWLLLGWWYYQSHRSCCVDSGGSETTLMSETSDGSTDVTGKVLGPLLFRWSSDSTHLQEGWNDLKASLLGNLEDNQSLEITGLYRSVETNNTTFENLGLARASKTRLLFPELPDNRITLQSRLVDDNVDQNGLFESALLASRVNTAAIKEVDDRALIYFPFNSTNKLNNAEIEKYLDDVAERVKASGETVSITGHTDNIGDDEPNLVLGQRRADIVKNYLLTKGVAADKIKSTSEGESRPVASNDTEAGQASNRRAELQIIP